MFCTNCGAQIEEGQSVCSKCGEAVEFEDLKQTVEPAPEKKTTGKPVKAIVFAVIYPVVLVFMAFFSMIRTIVTLSKFEPFSIYAKSLFINLGFSLVLTALGTVAIIIVLAVRKNKLTKMSLKDIFAECIMIAGLGLTNIVCSFVSNMNMAKLGAVALSANSVANSAVKIMSMSAVIGCIAVAAYLLGRSKAKVASIILSAAAIGLEAFLCVIASAASVKILSMYGTNPELMAMARPLFISGMWTTLFINAMILFIAWVCGNSKADHAFWPLIGPLATAGGTIVLGISFTGLASYLMLVLRLGPTIMVLGKIGLILGLGVGALVSLIAFIKFRNRETV